MAHQAFDLLRFWFASRKGCQDQSISEETRYEHPSATNFGSLQKAGHPCRDAAL